MLDEGFDAVAFNVMPEKEDTWVNKFQGFEYRKTMFLTKERRSASCSVGNVSGAIGLFRTKDIVFQKNYHSGLFGGEDQERTTLIYLYGTGRGVKYYNSLVVTEAPHTWRQLFRQRGIKFGGGWGAAHLNITILNIKLLISRRANFALKFEKAYQVFLVFSDPLRFMLFPFLLLDPVTFASLYIIYVLLEMSLWFWTRKQDSFWVVLFSPLYGVFNTIARFVAVPYWVKNRFSFLFREKFHLLVPARNLLAEWLFITFTLITLWGLSFFKVGEFLLIGLH